MTDAPAHRAGTPFLSIAGVSRHYGSVRAVDDVSLDIAQGEFFALLGPSGCGKTTLLRMLAGFETADAGRIVLDGEDLGPVPAHERPVNMMFQSYALFPHMSVAQNIGYGLRMAGVARRERQDRVDEVIALTRLEGLGGRRPSALSGGQRQRVALARALVRRPKLLLLDEPLGALDKNLRQQTQIELSRLQRTLGLTFVVVTHDQEEALSLAGRIAVMRDGRIAQIGTPDDLYRRPRSRYVAEFIGDVNMLEGTVSDQTEGWVRLSSGAELALGRGLREARGAPIVCALRPEEIHLLPAGAANGQAIPATVEHISYFGEMSLLTVRAENMGELRVAVLNRASNAVQPSVGKPVSLTWDTGAVIVLGDAAG